jgi:hypothetical protein
MDEGITQDELVKDWMYDSTFAVREDFYWKEMRNLLEHLRKSFH